MLNCVLVTKVNTIDTSEFFLNTSTDKSDQEKEIKVADKKNSDINKLLKKRL